MDEEGNDSDKISEPPLERMLTVSLPLLEIMMVNKHL